MEIKITVTVEGVEPIEVKVDIPEKDMDEESPVPSIYARFFDDECVGRWQPDQMKNKVFLMQMQHYFNMKLQADGEVYLNDVYEALGFDRVPEYENRVGWRHIPNNPNGDNYIDFGLFDLNGKGRTYEWSDLHKRYLLDFNVDGDISSYL